MDRIDNQPTNRSTNRPTQHPDGLLVVAGDATKRRGMHAPVPAVKLWRQEIIGAPPTAATTRALRGWCRGAARAGGAVDVCLCVIETHQIDVRMRRASCVVRRASTFSSSSCCCSDDVAASASWTSWQRRRAAGLPAPELASSASAGTR